ncbi:helix-turn-helix domain-containing protein [Niallia sp. NCCP-28]|uniref:helix-turn-helix domain-containing protein n=1 Tax=Niallia sp. NCCP-28 TaxID=2934712 RepID=UPI00208331FB|nr:helix-turn-helix domain-containing protein [Niallia sp. NCCP-28]GKU84593.1 hypothetical protein NCCP28_39890 [Niallia sp. NCCP-28]
MSQNTKDFFLNKRFNQFTFYVWTLDSYMSWILLEETNDLSAENEQLFHHLPWNQIEGKDYHAYITFYDYKTNSQMYIFETDDPEAIKVRSFVRTDRPLSEDDSNYFVMQIRYRLLSRKLAKQWQEHDAWLEGLRSLTSMLDLNQLLDNIMKNVLSVIPAVDRGFLTLYDPESQKLVPKASIGMGPSIYDFKTSIGEGIAGKVFDSGQGRIYNSAQANEAISNLKPKNYSSLMSAIANLETTINQTSMAVPVSMNQTKLGVMIVHQFKKKRPLSKEDLRRLQGFADQAAIAITNARLFSELRQTNDYLVKRNEIHEAFTKLSLNDTNLVKVSKTVERMIKSPVFLYDLTQNEWYPHSNLAPFKFEEAQLPKGWENHIEPLDTTINENKYHLYPIINEGIPIGLFIVKLSRPLQTLDTVILEQGGALVALKMVNTYSATDMHYKKSYEFFNELIQYKEPVLLIEKSKKFGLSPEKPLFVSVLQLKESTHTTQKHETYLRRLIASISKEIGSSENLIFGFHDKVTIIINVTNEESRELIIKKLKTSINWWKNNYPKVVIGGVGGLYTGLENISKSAEEANKSLLYLNSRNLSGLLKYENIGINRLFLNQQPKDIKLFIQEVLSPLQTPKALASDLETTLKTYIAANRSTSITAERLHIHPNTLYHRIKKIEEILSVNLDDPNDWLTLLLACHLSETY